MNRKIKIVVSGEAGVGKSTIIALLKNTLTAHQVDVELDIPDGEDSIPCFGLVNRRLRDLNDADFGIIIEERQALRSGW